MTEPRKPADRPRLHDDLRGIVRGDLHFDDHSRALYSTDASLFEIEPLGIVAPLDEADVCALVRYAVEHQVPLVPRGAGTGLAGESLGEGLIVDLSRHLRAIVDIGPDHVRVQPGVTAQALATALAGVGRRFAPLPTFGEPTVGGMLATNASGPFSLRHGYVRDHVQAVRLVLDAGEAVTASRHPRHPPARLPQPDDAGESETPGPGAMRLADIISSLATLLEQDAAQQASPRLPFDRCGYRLDGVLVNGQVDLPRLLVGSEGTLGLFTEATLATQPLPRGTSAVLLGFPGMDAALEAARIVGRTPAVACDLLDRRLLALTRPAITAPVPVEAEAVLLVEFEADSPREARRLAQELTDRLQRERSPVAALAAEGDEQVRLFRQVREKALPGLSSLRGGTRAVPLIEDVAVPVPALPEYLEVLQRLLQQQELTAAFLIQPLTGQVQARPLVSPGDVTRLLHLAEAVHELVLRLGGTISTRHGVGLARTPWVARQAGPLYPVFRQIKAIFDPLHLFNPGKIVGPAEPGRHWSLRRAFLNEPAPQGGTAEVLPLPLAGPGVTPWLAGEGLRECDRCDGCGVCRTESPGLRMCPIFRATHDEAASPRAKANLLRKLLHELGDARQVAAPEVRQIADLCVNCKMCERECPAGVNIPRLMLETKAANVARHGLDRTEAVLARTEAHAWVGSALAPIANAFLRNRLGRWLLERLAGVSRRRRLPRFAWRNFLRRAKRRGWCRKPTARRAGDRQRVAYFVDIFANYNDPSLAEAVVEVLHHNGVEVYVPPGQVGCGMAPLAYGDTEAARESLLANLRVLADLAREGYVILCSEPTAALMFRHDALDLLGEKDTDAAIVARQTVEWTEFLGRLQAEGQLRTDFQPLPLTVGHHVPCHLKALGGRPMGPALLSLIPGLRVVIIDVSCSGMAGTYGLKASAYETSLRAGAPMLRELARPGVQFGSTECSTCRMQMEDGAGKRTLHPAQWLALAYGLMPDLARRLAEPIGELVL